MLLQDQINKMKKVARDSEAIVAALRTNWLGKVFDMFGFSLSGWLTSLLQSLIMIVAMIVVIYIMVSFIKRVIVRSVSVVKYTTSEPVDVIDIPV